MLFLTLSVACSGEKGSEFESSDDLGTIGSGDASVHDDAGLSSDDAGGLCIDLDEDGFGPSCTKGSDCDDRDARLNRGEQAFVDVDGDGFGDEPTTLCIARASALPQGYAREGGDCVDDEPRAHPGVESDGCDDVDSDCDGKTDEDQEPEVITCGVGACRRSGMTTCTPTGATDDCREGEPSGEDEECNGIDDDCDGSADEGYVAPETTCSAGACVAHGLRACVAGALTDTCKPPQESDDDSTCDGSDDDCDGEVDEDFEPREKNCGVGACAAEGQLTCVDGKEQDSCSEKPAAEEDSTCDRKDDDCDGELDEDYEPHATSCGRGACRRSGRTSCENGSEVDSCQTGSSGSRDTTCDGVDDDCDGQTDEDFAGTAESCGRGACLRRGTTRCVSGRVVSGCTAGTPAANDASCDGIDNDCNGQTDEDFASASTSCGTGACARAGSRSCVNGRETNSCTAGTPAANDVSCDGVDSDCNGQTDEDFVNQATSCGAGACARTGTRSCVNGRETNSCQAGPPAANDASCNGVDNDCNGQTDEDFMSSTTTCGEGACSATGATSCVNGQRRNSCSEGQPGGSDATCDGIDSDCDGRADDDYSSRPTTCGRGACLRTGQTSCSAGAERDSCTAGPSTGSDNDCDGVDDDCDGQVDEAYVSTATQCGQGVCRRTGQTSCVGGQVRNSCQAGPTTGADNDCDGLDDDCDGAVDDAYASRTTSCGVGACAGTGRTSCLGGTEQNSCTTGTPAASDQSCDGVDSDCNGQIDEDYVARSTTCGAGACAATGQTRCANGAEQNSCTPRAPAPNDASCNRVDDDCNGQVDEDFVSTSTSCGRGVCARSGSTACNNGTLVDSCAPGSPTAPSDTTCNARDEDCDGSLDEDFVEARTTCGVGACLRSGATSCVSGAVRNSCAPGSPLSPIDATCNGVDDDCSGMSDEDYATRLTTCGVGACSARGMSSCVAGSERTNCTPGVPASSDPSCDGLDQDCNGTADEDYQSRGTQCGSGRCVSMGNLVCESGDERDTCSAPANECVPGSITCDGQQACRGNMRCTGERCGCEALACRQVPRFCNAQGRVCTTANQCGTGCDCGAPVCTSQSQPVSSDENFVYFGRDECGNLCDARPRCSYARADITCNRDAVPVQECGRDLVTGGRCGCRAETCFGTASYCTADPDGVAYSCSGATLCTQGTCSCVRCANGCNRSTGQCNLVIITTLPTGSVNAQPSVPAKAVPKQRTRVVPERSRDESTVLDDVSRWLFE